MTVFVHDTACSIAPNYRNLLRNGLANRPALRQRLIYLYLYMRSPSCPVFHLEGASQAAENISAFSAFDQCICSFCISNICLLPLCSRGGADGGYNYDDEYYGGPEGGGGDDPYYEDGAGGWGDDGWEVSAKQSLFFLPGDIRFLYNVYNNSIKLGRTGGFGVDE